MIWKVGLVSARLNVHVLMQNYVLDSGWSIIWSASNRTSPENNAWKSTARDSELSQRDTIPGPLLACLLNPPYLLTFSTLQRHSLSAFPRASVLGVACACLSALFCCMQMVFFVLTMSIRADRGVLHLRLFVIIIRFIVITVIRLVKRLIIACR